MEKILLFNVKDAGKIKKIASQMHIRTDEADVKDYAQTLECLAGLKPLEPDVLFTGAKPEGSMMLMCNVTDKHIDRLLFLISRDNIDIDYKAVLTPVNAKWTVSRMYAHMEMESNKGSKGI